MITFFVRIFAVTTGLFFCALLFSDLSIMPFREAAADALGSALVFGSALTLVMGTLHVVRVRRAARGRAEGDIYSVRQRRVFESPLGKDRLFAAAEHYLGSTRRFSISARDAEAGLLRATTPFNFSTSGSVVTVRLLPGPEGRTSVEVASRPAFFLILADYGDNLRLAEAVKEHLQALG